MKHIRWSRHQLPIQPQAKLSMYTKARTIGMQNECVQPFYQFSFLEFILQFGVFAQLLLSMYVVCPRLWCVLISIIFKIIAFFIPTNDSHLLVKLLKVFSAKICNIYLTRSMPDLWWSIWKPRPQCIYKMKKIASYYQSHFNMWPFFSKIKTLNNIFPNPYSNENKWIYRFRPFSTSGTSFLLSIPFNFLWLVSRNCFIGFEKSNIYFYFKLLFNTR